MKFGLIVTGVLLFAVFNASVSLADGLQENLNKAEAYYLDQNFKKAYKIYYKLAKTGDHFSQHQVSRMYAEGEGVSTDLNAAYGWSVLAAEGGKAEWAKNSEQLLQRVKDKSRAQKEAEKLRKKYGKQALQATADRKARRDAKNKNKCYTGSRMKCS